MRTHDRLLQLPRRTTAATGAVLLVLLTFRSVTAADPAPVDEKLLQDRHKQIVGMTQVEREHLQRNVAEFEKMSPERQQHYRELTRQLDENRASGGNLSSLMQTYSVWLKTLTPGQREELRQETDSARKLILVRKFKEEQYHPIDTLTEALPEYEPMGPRPPGGLKPLSASELNSMMKVLVADLPSDQQERFARATRASQYVEILQHSIHHSPDGPRGWPSVELQEKLLASIKKTELRNVIKARQGHQREIEARLLFFNVGNYAWEEVRSKWPKDADLEKTFNQLNTDEKSRLDQLPRDKRRRELVRRYFEQEGDPSLKQMDDIRMNLGRLMSQLNLSPPRMPHLGDGGPPGRRGDPGSPNDRGDPGPLGDHQPADPPPPRDGRPRRSPGSAER